MPSVILSDNGVSSGSAGLKSTAASDGVLVLQTTTSGGTATTAVTADNLQNVGFGGVTPNVWQSTRKAIQVGDTSALAYGGNQTTVGNNFFINSSGTNSYIKASTYAHIYIQGSDGSHEWYTAPNTGTAGGSASFTRLLAVNTGYSLALQGANSQTGTGITFPATQSASSNANTLDDYEEGTWTPTWYGSGTAGTPSGSASGIYTKIGNMVTVVANFSAINLTGATGNFIIGGLPFSQSSGGNGACYFEGINPTYQRATVTGSGLAVSPYGGTQLALKPSITTLWDNYLSAASTFTGGGGSTYGYFTATYFV